jgi:hypothetical protein
MTGMETFPIGPVIAAIVSVALYGATYLSLLRLMNYPRNWCRPTLLAWFGTLGPAGALVAFLSLSFDGVDVAALCVSTGFIAVLFLIIAAPAIAFKPAPRAIEFLARHGDYAGLWMLAPAIAAGYAIPSLKLQAFLAAAMAIETMWVLRYLGTKGRRRLYPIDGHDLAVLNTQAKGDLEGFARRHGIHELVLADGAVAWRGCAKNTLPCSFNLYVDHLGLNTAPCCREHMKELCYAVDSWLDEMGVVHWLESGTLLGAVRENGTFLAWEDDVDISFLIEGDMTWATVAAGLAAHGARDGYFVGVFEEIGFISVAYDAPRRWPLRWERNRMRGEIRVDLAVYAHAMSHEEPVLERRSRKGAMPVTESGGHGVPPDVVLPTATIAFLGGEFPCPNRPEDYLHILYGDFGKIEYSYVDATAAVTRRQVDAAGDARSQGPS